MYLETIYDVMVIGAGHAGTEAALAAARMGGKTLLVTHNLDLLGQMSCDPAIGGIGKGHLVREIDALDGIMAKAADRAGIQFRTLNASKGPAVWATRVQTDRILYRQAIREALQAESNITLLQQHIDSLIIENGKVQGVVTQMGLKLYAKAVVLTVGTFLGGRIHVGSTQFDGGRAGDPPSLKLADNLKDLDLPIGRLKTGTPPRIDGKSVDFSVMNVQHGDNPLPLFSYLSDFTVPPKQIPCYITHTTKKTKEIIERNISKSPMYSGVIDALGPRYCPSIEDKIVRFADKEIHQIFVEPEGLTTNELYPNGISTSLPFEVQLEFIKTLEGFENAIITRPGYAIEYYYFDPRGLTHFLQTKAIENLFFAGQINGTTGYEEAAAQGIIAGLNAMRLVQEKPLWVPKRDEAYIGVLIDDLVTCGTQEPYRMFTSRAEYRLLLREDNADLRLTKIGRDLGVVGDIRWNVFQNRLEDIDNLKAMLKTTKVKEFQNLTAAELMKRPEINYEKLRTMADLPAVSPDLALQIEIQYKYSGYIERQESDIIKLRKHEELIIPDNFNYKQISGLSNEVMQKLIKVQPKTIAQAGRIPGITPAALSLLLIFLKKQKQMV